MPAPDYALCQPEKLNGGQLSELIAAMPLELVVLWENGLKRTVAEKRTFITQAKAAYWNVIAATKHTPVGKSNSPMIRLSTPASSLHTITGTECNAWLATLPETPLYEADD